MIHIYVLGMRSYFTAPVNLYVNQTIFEYALPYYFELSMYSARYLRPI